MVVNYLKPRLSPLLFEVRTDIPSHIDRGNCKHCDIPSRTSPNTRRVTCWKQVSCKAVNAESAIRLDLPAISSF